MKKIYKDMSKVFLQLLIAAVFVMSFSVFADEVIELEFGNEAYEEFMSYKLENGYLYEVGDPEILRIESGILYPNRFGDSKITVSDLEGNFIKDIEVIVYFVGEELTPFSPATINEPYLSGYPDGTFKPKNFMTRAELAALMNELIKTKTNHSLSYIDLPDDHWASEVIYKAVSLGFLYAKEDEIYPDAFITREDMARLIMSYSKLKHLEIDDRPLIIEDIKAYESSIYHAINTGAMTFDGNNFRPYDFLKREEVVKIINVITCRKIIQTPRKFNDVEISNPFFFDIQASAK